MRVFKKLLCPQILLWATSPKSSTRTFWGLKALLLLLAVMLPLSLHAQNNYVYVNNQSAANSVLAYSVSPAGALTTVAGSPFSTGGKGAKVNCYALDRIVVSPAANLLFVANTGDQTITAFQINPATGALTKAPGSPFASGLTLDSCQGISLAPTPDGLFLMASSNGKINTFSLAANGGAALLSTTATCCTPLDSMKISTDGKFLAAADTSGVSLFAINAGVLTPVPGSPFPKTGTDFLAGLDFSGCSVNRVYGGESSSLTNTADAWSMDATGVLSPVPGSPFHAPSGTNSNVVLMTPDNQFLYESNQSSNSVNAFTVNADGTLAAIGKFGGVGFLHTPSGMAMDNSGTFLYVADDPFGVAILRVNADGTLTNIKDQSITSPIQIQGVAAYPPRACATADLSISMTASPDPVAVNTNVTYVITVTNNGPNAAAVTISDSLPSTLNFVSCTATNGGVCVGTINARNVSFSSLGSGVSATVTIVGHVAATVPNNTLITNVAKISNSSAVDPNLANNSASASVTALVPAPTLITVPAVTGTYGGSVTLSATLLKKSDSSPVVGETITFTMKGIAEGTAVTDGTGTAKVVAALGTIPAGTYAGAVVAKFAGDARFAANTGTAQLTVNKAVLTVTAGNASRNYGDPNPAFTYTITGFVNGETQSVISGTPSCTTAATPSSAIGTYPIVCSLGTLAATNYTFAFVNGTLTVNPVPLTVTVANATRAYGAPNPTFTGTIVGIKNGDNITAAYSTTATATSPTGTYPITATLVDPGNVLGNYIVTINNGTLTITGAPLTVTAANASMLYGDPVPVLTGTITGIVNGDNITATYTTVATQGSPVGAYAIVPVLSDNGTGKLASYSVTVINGILTINPAPLTVNVDSFIRLYGDPNPALTATILGIKNGDNITASLSVAADPTSPVGTYPIVATLIDPGTKLGNYAVTINNGVLTINPAPLTVSAGNASRLFGTPNPPSSGIITGLKNGDSITAGYSTTAVATSPVGTYPITPALVDPAGKLGNYTVTSNNGTLTVNTAPTANFVFVNNQAAAGNSISGYSVALDGTLTNLAGSPVATGGLGANAACSSVNRLALSAGNNLLFVSNGGDQSISVFQIDPASGALTPAAGSPFASGLTLDACSGISLSATPDGQYLMASSNGQINTFSIGVGGALTSLSTAANAASPNAGMKISANGQLLAVANGSSVSVFSINGDGSLTAVAGSPFAEAGTGSLAGLDFSSTSGLLYGAEASATAAFADAWTVGANGLLSTVTGSPFSTTAINSNVVLLSPNNSFLFASNQGSNSVSSFSVAADGSLSSLGSFGSAASLHAPVGMATDRSGSLLYVADDTFGVAVFSINGAGSLAQLGDTAIAGAGQVQDLVAYPPRMASNADVSVSVAAGSPNVVAGQNVTYTITVTNNGADPAAATVTDSLPAGFTLVSCTATGNGACIGTTPTANFYLLQSGETQTATLVASTSLSIADGTVATNSVSINNSSAVDSNAANNSASVDVTVAQPATTGLAVSAASGTYGGSTTLSATLTNASGPLAGKTVNFTLNGLAAGSAVTDATGLASVSASLAGINAGSYPAAVNASFAGDANNAAGSGTAALTVNTAALTVTAANATRPYGDPNPAFTGTITGLVNGDTITATYSSTATATSPAGSYSIVPTLVDPGSKLSNYTVTVTNGTLTVSPAVLTITAANASMLYGDPVPALSGTIAGIKNGENITATYSTTATSASPVGTYGIVASVTDNGTGALVNYSVVLVDGTLTINPAPLTVTAANASMLFGDPLPAFSGTITGIRNGNNITATYSTTATSTSPVGTYPIVPAVSDNGTGALANYTVVVNNGTLTINQAVLTVTAANASMLFGDPLPAFSGTITGIRNGNNITATYSTTATSASAVGTYPIVPAVSDNGTGALANYTVVVNNGTLTISPAPLTVTAANASRLYGDPNPPFTGTITGLKNGDTIGATFSAAADPTSPVGNYAIVPTLSDPNNQLSNYTVTLNNGVLAVNPAPLNVTAANAGRLYGDPNPAFSGTITGIKNADNITATYASATDPTTTVGTYPIVPTLVDPTNKLSNYVVTSTNGTLTISPAPLTIQANDATAPVGGPFPSFTGTITGLKNTDVVTASYSTTADATSPAGTYPIIPAADANPVLVNYAVTLINGTLTLQ